MVAVHRSPSAAQAMRQAARLAHLTNARLKALYVEDLGRFIYVPMLTWATAPILGDQPLYAPLPPQDLIAEQERQGEEEESLRTAFREVCGKEGLSGEFHVLQGSVDDVLLTSSRTVDLMVMGYRHTPLFTGALFERVLRQSVRPILMVSDSDRVDGPILFAYDGSRAAQRSLSIGASLIELNAWKGVMVVTAANDSEEAVPVQDEVREYLLPYTTQTGFSVSVGEAGPSILEAADMCKAGLIVMGAFGDASVSEFLFGSTTQEVLAEAPCPVLLAS